MNKTDIDANVPPGMRGLLGILLGASRFGFLPWHILQDTLAEGRRSFIGCSSPDEEFVAGRRFAAPCALWYTGNHWL